MKDHYRPIEGFPGYRVSREGEVQSCRGRGTAGRLADEWHPLKPSRRPKGYLSVNLQAAGVKSFHFIHHLVLEAFVGPRPPGLICCHNDGNPANNCVANLRWDSYLSNSEDMLRHGTRPMGSRCNAKLGEGDVREIRRLPQAQGGGSALREHRRCLRRQPPEHPGDRRPEVIAAPALTYRSGPAGIPGGGATYPHASTDTPPRRLPRPPPHAP